MTSLEITVILGIEKITEMSPAFLPNLLIISPSSVTPLSTTLFLFYLFRISQAVVLLQHVYWPLLASTCNPFKAQPCWPDRYKVSIRARRGEKEVFTWWEPAEFTELRRDVLDVRGLEWWSPQNTNQEAHLSVLVLSSSLGPEMWWAFVCVSVFAWKLHVVCLCSGSKSDWWTWSLRP